VKRSNLKIVTNEKPEPLTYEQLVRLARGVRDSAIDDEWLLGALMMLTREIVNNCFDAQHVETVAMVLEDHLYAVTVDCNEAQRRFIEARRAEFLKGAAK
jgi:hypothetical protein